MKHDKGTSKTGIVPSSLDMDRPSGLSMDKAPSSPMPDDIHEMYQDGLITQRELDHECVRELVRQERRSCGQCGPIATILRRLNGETKATKTEKMIEVEERFGRLIDEIIRELFTEEYSYPAVAERLNVSVNTLYNWLLRLNLRVERIVLRPGESFVIKAQEVDDGEKI